MYVYSSFDLMIILAKRNVQAVVKAIQAAYLVYQDTPVKLRTITTRNAFHPLVMSLPLVPSHRQPRAARVPSNPRLPLWNQCRLSLLPLLAHLFKSPPQRLRRLLQHRLHQAQAEAVARCLMLALYVMLESVNYLHQ